MAFYELLSDQKLGRKLKSYAYLPRNRKEADRIAKSATPDAVSDLGEVFRTADLAELSSAPPFSMAVALLANAAGGQDPAAAEEAGSVLYDVGLRLRDDNTSESPHYDPTWRYVFWETLSLFPDIPAAARAFNLLDEVYRELPESRVEAWAREAGIDLPRGRSWTVKLVVPSAEPPHFDLELDLTWVPEREARGQIRACEHWWSADPEDLFWAHPVYATQPPIDSQRIDLTTQDDGGRTLQTTLAHPVTGPWDFKQFVDDFEAATGTTLDRSKTAVTEAKRQRSTAAVRKWLKG